MILLDGSMRVLLVETRQVTEIFGVVLEGAGNHVLLGKNVVNVPEIVLVVH